MHVIHSLIMVPGILLLMQAFDVLVCVFYSNSNHCNVGQKNNECPLMKEKYTVYIVLNVRKKCYIVLGLLIQRLYKLTDL